MFYVICVSICISICIIFAYTFLMQQKKKENIIKKELEENYIKSRAQELETNFQSLKNEQINKFQKETEQYKQELTLTQTQLSGARIALENIEQQIVKSQELALEHEKRLKFQAEERLKEYETELVCRAQILEGELNAKAEANHIKACEQLDKQRQEITQCIKTLQDELAEYQQKRQTANEAILRQRAIEEQQDFYRVCLTDDAISDISFLQTARRNLRKPEILDKLIYDNYIAKPVLELVKRVLKNGTPSGIYKITCLKTGEIYIGKSTDLKSRWQQHCKSAFNCGTIASSLLHTKMKQYGIENFTFELLEEVEKDKLTAREKYWITFYDSINQGLNQRNG